MKLKILTRKEQEQNERPLKMVQKDLKKFKKKKKSKKSRLTSKKYSKKLILHCIHNIIEKKFRMLIKGTKVTKLPLLSKYYKEMLLGIP